MIDRNDELCILYERSNQQQDALKKGEIILRQKEEEVRLITLQMNELKRQYLAANKRVPDIAKYEQEIVELENQLMLERSETDQLSSQLEDPGNVNRWRPLDGDDSTIEQLISKTNLLEERLDLKREQLLEKDLILEEVTTLTDRLKSQALKKKESSKSMADELNSLQARIRDVTKKMLASVSELSMYQVRIVVIMQVLISLGYCTSAATRKSKSRETL